MNKILKFSAIALFLLNACVKPTDSNWHVKYEITSTSSIPDLMVVYKTKTGGTAQTTISSLPWSFEDDWPKNLGSNSSARGLSVATLYSYSPNSFTVKIYVNGSVVAEGVNPIIVSYLLQ